MQNLKLQLEYKPTQLILPVNLEHKIDERDPVISFKEVVGGLNLAQFIQSSPKGRNDYSVEMMIHVILFGFMENIRSLRALEKACKVDVRFMYLTQGETPSFMAFQRFIDTKLTCSIEDIFTHINRFLIEKESIDTTVLYVDGTKIEANANKFSFVWKKSILNYQAKLFLKINRFLQALSDNFTFEVSLKDHYHSTDLVSVLTWCEKRFEAEGTTLVSGKGRHKSPLQRHYDQLNEAYHKLKEYEEHLLICQERNSYSKSDHDATFMHGKEDYYSKTGIFKPYYNIQIGVSDEYILHYGVFPNPTDTKTWIPFFESFKKRYGFYPKHPIADAGYGSYDNYLFNLTNNMSLSMKYSMFSKEDDRAFKKKEFYIKHMEDKGDVLISASGHVYRYSHDYHKTRQRYLQIKQVYVHETFNEALKDQGVPHKVSKDVIMSQLQDEAKRFLSSEEGIRYRIQRSIEVEGAFGDIKSNCEYTRIRRRGKKRVCTEIALVLIGYNLKKYHAKKQRFIQTVALN
jgi:transposase